MQISETNLSFNKQFQQELESLVKEELKLKLQLGEGLPLHSVSLYGLPLTPIDCLSLGYYINKKTFLSTPIKMQFNLSCCSIDRIGLHVLFTELKKSINHRTPVRVRLALNGNKFDNESLLSLKKLLQGQSNLEGLGLCACFDPSVLDLRYALKCLIEGLANNSTCTFVDLSLDYGFDSSHIHYFVLMLRACPQLQHLNLLNCDLSKVMPLFYNAVLTSKLYLLDISYCNISDSDLISLGEIAFTVAQSKRHCLNLSCLSVSGNPITHDGLSIFLKLLWENPLFYLRFFGIDLEFNSEQNQTLNNINDFRTFLTLEPLVCRSFYHMPLFLKVKRDNEILYHTRQQLTQT